MRLVLRMSAGVALVLGLAGCVWSPASPVSKGDLSGEWHSAEGARLELYNDGTLEVDGVPKDVWGDWDPTNLTGEPKGEPIEASGTWLLVNQSGGMSRQAVQVSSEGGINYLWVLPGRPISLALVLGDPDSHDFYEFVKDDGEKYPSGDVTGRECEYFGGAGLG